MEDNVTLSEEQMGQLVKKLLTKLTLLLTPKDTLPKNSLDPLMESEHTSKYNAVQEGIC